MIRSVDRGVLISQSEIRAELLSQTCKGRSSLGNHVQIPWWGQRCGQRQGEGRLVCTKEEKVFLFGRKTFNFNRNEIHAA